MESFMSNYKFIGVTGHRDLKEDMIDIYANIVSQKLLLLKNKHEKILILSALADGADRLVVREGIKLNIEFIAILPMYKNLYKKDFNEISEIEFDTLLSKAKDVISLDILKDNTFSGIKNYGIQRDKQYEAAGRKICEHSDILLSLWDGIDNNLTGGTSETIKYFLKHKGDRLCYNLMVKRKSKSIQDKYGISVLKNIITFTEI
jgi:hypothetical protein